MADISTLPKIEPGATPCEVDLVLPGGALIKGIVNPEQSVPQLSDIVNSLLAQIQPATAVFAPIFSIVEVVTEILNVFNAIPDAITSLDVTALNDAITDLTAVINEKILPLLPATAMIPFFCSFTNFLILWCDSIIGVFNPIKDSLINADTVIQQGIDTGRNEIVEAGQAVRENVMVQTNNVIKSICPINKVLDLVNALFSLISLEIPSLDIPEETESTEGLEDYIDDFVSVLEAFKSAIETVREVASIC